MVVRGVANPQAALHAAYSTRHTTCRLDFFPSTRIMARNLQTTTEVLF